MLIDGEEKRGKSTAILSDRAANGVSAQENINQRQRHQEDTHCSIDIEEGGVHPGQVIRFHDEMLVDKQGGHQKDSQQESRSQPGGKIDGSAYELGKQTACARDTGRLRPTRSLMKVPSLYLLALAWSKGSRMGRSP